jgi:hypothetical protein
MSNEVSLPLLVGEGSVMVVWGLLVDTELTARPTPQ